MKRIHSASLFASLVIVLTMCTALYDTHPTSTGASPLVTPIAPATAQNPTASASQEGVGRPVEATLGPLSSPTSPATAGLLVASRLPQTTSGPSEAETRVPTEIVVTRFPLATSDAAALATGNPRPTMTPVRQTRSGTVRLYRSVQKPEQSRLDLDTGRVTGPDDAEADIEFFTSIGSGVFDFLKPVNDATAGVFHHGVSGYDDCYLHRDELLPSMMFDWDTGPICVLTNQGRLGLLIFRDMDLDVGEDWVEFQYTTWYP